MRCYFKWTVDCRSSKQYKNCDLIPGCEELNETMADKRICKASKLLLAGKVGWTQPALFIFGICHMP